MRRIALAVAIVTTLGLVGCERSDPPAPKTAADPAGAQHLIPAVTPATKPMPVVVKRFDIKLFTPLIGEDHGTATVTVRNDGAPGFVVVTMTRDSNGQTWHSDREHFRAQETREVKFELPGCPANAGLDTMHAAASAVEDQDIHGSPAR